MRIMAHLPTTWRVTSPTTATKVNQRATASAAELQEVVKPASLPANVSATFSAGPSYVLNAGVVGNGGLHARVATVAPTATHAASTTAATTQPVSVVVAAAAAAAADSAAAVAAGPSGLHAASAATATDAVPVAGSVHPSASADDAKAKAAARKRKQQEKQLKAVTDKHGGEAGMKMYKAERNKVRQKEREREKARTGRGRGGRGQGGGCGRGRGSNGSN